ncbi:MAG: prepilin-type N-terminal cleavage/methylation domain-containing protein [Proteobacteria bacterium]|nr:prepilin-type N-terminal cleavage/methylation domain-containing protein [Pseudomonadota bacterium]
MVSNRKRDEGGFTLIELMIVTAVIGVLAGIVIPHYLDLKDKTTWMTARENMDVIRGALSVHVTQDNVQGFPSGTLDFDGLKAALAQEYLPLSEQEAFLVPGSFIYTSTEASTFSFSAHCANRGRDLLTASVSGIRPLFYEDYEGVEDGGPGIGRYRRPRTPPSPGP